MIRRPPRSTPLYSSAASDVYKRQLSVTGHSRAPGTCRGQAPDGRGREHTGRRGTPYGPRQSASPTAPARSSPSVPLRRSQPDLASGEPAGSLQGRPAVLDGQVAVGVDRGCDRGVAQQLLHAPVSYTHLRAHESKANLVCRLLLEKKKK